MFSRRILLSRAIAITVCCLLFTFTAGFSPAQPVSGLYISAGPLSGTHYSDSPTILPPGMHNGHNSFSQQGIPDSQPGPVPSEPNRPNYPPLSWAALPNGGMDDYVFAIEEFRETIYVGGRFTQTTDLNLTGLGNIARYYPAANSWDLLPNKGLDNFVYALAAHGDDVYVGGVFDATNDPVLSDLGGIARFDTNVGTWHKLANGGLDGFVYAMAVAGNDLYVGGFFKQTGDKTVKDLNNIARYNLNSETWHPLSKSGLDDDVFALEIIGDDLYVGGRFDNTRDGTVNNLGNIARYEMEPQTWYALPNQGLNGAVRTLAAVGDDLYAGGDFTESGNGSVKNLGYIARYQKTSHKWFPLSNKGLDYEVYALKASGDDLYVGGSFGDSGDATHPNLNNIARYDTVLNAWNQLPNQGLDRSVNALATSGSDLYAGGSFTKTYDSNLAELGNVARCALAIPEHRYLPLAIK